MGYIILFIIVILIFSGNSGSSNNSRSINSDISDKTNSNSKQTRTLNTNIEIKDTEYINSTSNKPAKAIKFEKEIDNNYKKQKNEANNQDADKIEFLSAQGINIISQILNTTYDQHFDKLDTTVFNYDMRVSIFNKKLDRVNGNKLEYATALKRNILYYYNLNKDMYEYLSSCIKNKKFPESVSQWQAPFTQLEIKNKITDINKARNKERLDAYERFENSIQKLISELEWDYTYFYMNSWILRESITTISVNSEFVKPLLKESSNAVIKEIEKGCHIKTIMFLNLAEKTSITNESNFVENKAKTFKEFYSNKTEGQLKNDVDEIYYSKLKELNLKDASFGRNGSKEFLGAVELALFEPKLKCYIEKGIENVFTRDWGSLDFSEYMDEVIEKYSSITINEWNESYNYFEKNHSWLEEHPCASQDVAVKRFDFLRERNQW